VDLGSLKSKILFICSSKTNQSKDLLHAIKDGTKVKKRKLKLLESRTRKRGVSPEVEDQSLSPVAVAVSAANV
jgi:hypothetical protein